MKITIDKNTCVGCGLCDVTCPEVFKLGNDGIAEANTSICPHHDIKHVIKICPVNAISLEEIEVYPDRTIEEIAEGIRRIFNGGPIPPSIQTMLNAMQTNKGGENMPPEDRISDEVLKEIRDRLAEEGDTKVRAWMIKDEIKKKLRVDLDESTIRGRFIEMGEPLSGMVGEPNKVDLAQEEPQTAKFSPSAKEYQVPKELEECIPKDEEFVNYIVRDIDKRLALHLDSSRPGHWKYPIAQGKQGTGKTYSYMYYAWNNKLPFLLYSMYDDFRLPKLFGDKTIINGSRA